MPDVGEENICVCGKSCLLYTLAANAEPLKLRIKDPGAVIYRDREALYFPLTDRNIPAERLLGSYENRHRQALKVLKDYPVSGIAPVTALCDCYYGIGIIDGKVLFNANTIPECLKDRQFPVINSRLEKISYRQLAKWAGELARALRELHLLGLSHGDATVFNVVVDIENHAHWIDLENLNFDRQQIDNDTASFIFHVFLFACELVPEIPEDLWCGLGKIFESSANEQEVLDKFIALMDAPGKLIPAPPAENRARTLALLGNIPSGVMQREFMKNCMHYLFRSSVYFQKDFLWLANWNSQLLNRGDVSEQLAAVNDTLAKLEQMREDLQWSLNLERENSGKWKETLLNREKEFSAFENRLQQEISSVSGQLESEKQRAAELSASLESEKQRAAELSASLESEKQRAAELSASLDIERNKNMAMDARLKDEVMKNTELAEKLQAESERLSAAECRIRQLSDQIAKLAACEVELADKNAELKKLQAENAAYRDLLCALRNTLEASSQNFSFRIAKALQIVRHPSLAGMPGRFSALGKMILSKISRKEFAPGYLACDTAINQLDNGVAAIAGLGDFENCEVPDVPDENVLISIVLPVYNQADMVHESIESVLAQTYSNWELIIINDGSKDGLAEAVAPYLKDKRIHYLEQANQRLPKALSNGFSFVSGELLTWTSADNIMHPQMLRRLSAFLRHHPEVTMVYADYMVIDDHGEPFTAQWFRPHNRKSPDSPDIRLPRSTRTLNTIQDNFIGACFMYRRAAKALINDYDPRLGVEDYDYWMRINSMMKISHLGSDESLYRYRVHDNSLSAQAAELKITEKCMHLMEYEKERFSFYFKPFDIYGSYLQSDLIYGDFPVIFHNGNYEKDDLPGKFDKRILLVKGGMLASYTPAELKRYNYIGVFFAPGEKNDIGKNAYLIRRFKIKCFALPGSEESRRLKVMINDSVECQPFEMGLYTMIGANNHLFFKGTHSAEEISRVLPVVPAAKNGRVIVLLENLGNGGMEQVAYDMVRCFNAAGQEALLVSVNGKGADVKLPEDIICYTLDEAGREEDFKRLLAEKEHQAVISHYCTWGAEMAFEAGIPFFQVIHNSYCWFEEKHIREYLDADRFTAGYIAVSANAAWYAMENLNLPAEKMMIIENGVEFEKFNYSESGRKAFRERMGFADNHFVLLNPASCHATKGQLNLVSAFAAAYRKNPDLRLVMAGKIMDNSYYKQIKAVIAREKLESVVFADCFFENMAEVYSGADVVVLPSFWEGCSLAVAETIHMRRPLLATNVGDIQRQTDCCNCVLMDLPYNYLTELNGKTYSKEVFKPHARLIEIIEKGIEQICSGDYPRGEYTSFSEQPAQEVYGRYLKIINYFSGNFSIEAIRHNV